jgi:hypothetical protein
MRAPNRARAAAKRCSSSRATSPCRTCRGSLRRSRRQRRQPRRPSRGSQRSRLQARVRRSRCCARAPRSSRQDADERASRQRNRSAPRPGSSRGRGGRLAPAEAIPVPSGPTSDADPHCPDGPAAQVYGAVLGFRSATISGRWASDTSGRLWALARAALLVSEREACGRFAGGRFVLLSRPRRRR